MEASVRLLANPRHLFLLPGKTLRLNPPSLYYHRRPQSLPSQSIVTSSQNPSPIFFPQIQFPNPLTPSGLSHSLSSSQFFLSSLSSTSSFARIFSGPKGKSFEWNYAQNTSNNGEIGVAGDNEPEVTAVVLGWLGSKPRHLKRFVEFYNSKGHHAVTFVASPSDVLSIDLGRKLEHRISGLASELISWLSQSENNGRDRFLTFHTFSSTGWLVYGAILELMQTRPDLLEKIKGCVVDSGGDPNLDPKVWAAGFTAAVLKRHSSLSYPSSDVGERNESQRGDATSNLQKKEPLFIEMALLLAFEKLFASLLYLPSINQRLTKIISIHMKNLPPCPQLYLYSTADKVIPYRSVESFIEVQRSLGRIVRSFNFGTSPHVDHYRTFPNEYLSHLDNFLKECLGEKIIAV